MVAMKYTVTAERGRSGVWVLQCVEVPGAISEARSLSSAPDLMREAIAFVADVDESDVEIVLDPVLPERVAAEAAEARRAVAELAEVQRRTAELSRAAVRDMVNAGLSGRDVSVVLDISPQRVSQLLASSSS